MLLEIFLLTVWKLALEVIDVDYLLLEDFNFIRKFVLFPNALIVRWPEENISHSNVMVKSIIF